VPLPCRSRPSLDLLAQTATPCRDEDYSVRNGYGIGSYALRLVPPDRLRFRLTEPKLRLADGRRKRGRALSPSVSRTSGRNRCREPGATPATGRSPRDGALTRRLYLACLRRIAHQRHRGPPRWWPASPLHARGVTRLALSISAASPASSFRRLTMRWPSEKARAGGLRLGSPRDPIGLTCLFEPLPAARTTAHGIFGMDTRKLRRARRRAADFRYNTRLRAAMTRPAMEDLLR
jgi:hypothetical protein